MNSGYCLVIRFTTSPMDTSDEEHMWRPFAVGCSYRKIKARTTSYMWTYDNRWRNGSLKCSPKEWPHNKHLRSWCILCIYNVHDAFCVYIRTLKTNVVKILTTPSNTSKVKQNIWSLKYRKGCLDKTLPVIRAKVSFTLLGIFEIKNGPLVRAGLIVIKSRLWSCANWAAAFSLRVFATKYG